MAAPAPVGQPATVLGTDDEPAVRTEHGDATVEPVRTQQPPTPRTVTFDENDDLDVPDFLK